MVVIMRGNYIYSMGNWFYKRKLKTFSRMADYLNYLLHNSYIPSKAKIGKDTKFAYGGIAVVIHDKAVIGRHCLLGQGITIGGKSGSLGVPVIKDNVHISTGAKILGDITIGHDSIIGANAVVINDVKPYSVVAGMPAKTICMITEENFIKKYQHYYGPKKFLDGNNKE